MDAIQGLNGLQITSCIVRHDFATVCPEYTLELSEGHTNKKTKLNSDAPEHVFYRPFQNDVKAANRYLDLSPRATEVLELLKSESPDLRSRAISLLCFLLTQCNKETSKQYIADQVLTTLCEQISDLLHLNDDSLHYLFTILLECIRIAPADKVRMFLSACNLFKFLGKHTVPKNSSAGFSVSRFYLDMVTHDVVDDVGLCDYISVEGDDVKSSADLLHSNSKKQLCILLLVGLKGFNILEKPSVVRLIFEHIKHDALMDSICTIRLFILIMSQVLSTQCARLSLTLSNMQWSDVPETVISSTAATLSHKISQITEEPSFTLEQIVRLNRLTFTIFAEFIENLETICDYTTLSNVLLKFDATHLSVVDLILAVLRSKPNVGPLYMPALKCTYSGNMEYLVLIKFMSNWFTYLSGISIPPEECLSYIPPFLSQAFFNYGLLSSDQWVRHGALRLLNILLVFVTNVRDAGSAVRGSEANVSAFTEHICLTIPDFKTIINVKRHTENKTQDDASISLNIKNKKRSMVSNELGSIVTSEQGNVILDIKESDLILTDWLKCLYLYSRFVGVADGKSLYDPCKLLKDEIIAANMTEMDAALRAPTIKLSNMPTFHNVAELNMALMGSLFHLGIGEVHSGLVLSKVQRSCFNHILRRYLDLKCAIPRVTTDATLLLTYLSICEGYVRHVIEGSGVFSSPAGPWISALESEADYQMFTFLFDYCMENPLDVLLGCLPNSCRKGTFQSFKCLNCSGCGDFEGPLFLKLSLGFLLHLCSDSPDDLECESCNVREFNMLTIFKERAKDSDISSYVQYVLKACTSVDVSAYKIHIDHVLKTISPKYTIATLGVDAVEVGEVATKSTAEVGKPTEINVDDSYLAGCSILIDVCECFDQDIDSLKDFARILIDILVMRINSSENSEKTIRKKWESRIHAELITKYMTWEMLTIYTHLFSSLITLLDAVGDIKVDKDVFDGVTFDNDVLWAQHYYLSHRLQLNSAISDVKTTTHRLTESIRKLCSSAEASASSETTAAALTFSKVCSLVPQHYMADCAPHLVKMTLERISLPLVCHMCQDVLTCEYGLTTYLLDIASCLTTHFNDPQFAVDLLQWQRLMDLTKEVCDMNSKKYFVGDTIESNLFVAHLTLLRSMVNHAATAQSSIVGIKTDQLYNLIQTISSCYRCSYSSGDIMVKDVIMGIVKIASDVIKDPKSAVLRLPQFKDFACISKLSSGHQKIGSRCTCAGVCHHDIQTHGQLRGWVTMVSGFAIVAEESNWLCMNSKRLSMTLLSFPANSHGGSTCLRSTFRNLAILYPPSVNRSPKKSDEVFGCIIRLNKILNSNSKYLQQFVVGGPYAYDVDYLIPFFTGRLCMMLYNQLFIYKHEFDAAFREFGFDGSEKIEYTQNTFTKTFSLSEAREAAKRLHNQIHNMRFEYDIGDAFSPLLVEQLVKNGVFEICSLGLLSKSMRKYSMKALGIIMSILQNMLDATMVKSIIPGSQGPFKLRRVGLFGIYQIHSVLSYLQRSQLYATKGDPTLHILFASQIVRRVTNPDDPMYKLGNKYLLSRFEPRFQEVPLFFDCFSVHESSERNAFLAFILQFLLASAHLSCDHSVLFERRIFQQLMSFALLDTTSYENRIQICGLVQRCAEASPETTAELLSLGTATWVSTMASRVRCNKFNDAKDIVLSTVLLCTLTLLLRNLGAYVAASSCADFMSCVNPTSSGSSADGNGVTKGTRNADEQMDIKTNIKDFICSLEASQNVADAWYHLLSSIPNGMLTPLRVEGYRTYVLTIAGVAFEFGKIIGKEVRFGGSTVKILLSTALEETHSAIKRVSGLLASGKCSHATKMKT
ncbi:hypothetical protein X943_001336 [Babesia divergens]|uniref:URB1 C-terminal domain-containing protein n=1 Tax=Babesia divergens TaxID=32595 RepID=A0AAD9LKF0_BABDI|nr:hypothetical protein X943_001336 [Babesia divergens]